MRADKIVLMSVPLAATAPLLKAIPSGEKIPVTAFLTYYRDKLSGHGWMPMVVAGEHEAAVAALLADGTDPDPIGEAFLGGLREAIAQADADPWRVYDQVHLDGAAADPDIAEASEALYALYEQLEDRSVLLEPVAQAVLDMMPTHGMQLGAVTEIRNRLTPDSPTLGLGPVLDNDHQTAAATSSVLWSDVEALAPGTRERLVALVMAVYANLPTPAPEGTPSTRFETKSTV